MIDGAAAAFAAVGAATLGAALLPRLLGRVPVSIPMVFVAAGMIAFALIPDLPNPDPLKYGELTLHVTEICVIISLMGAGLALNRRIGWRRWSTTWRLLAITMPLSMLAVALIGWSMLGLGVAAAVLLAAALAPTDPVLATEVQVGEPTDDGEADDDEVRFALTSEAGLNDGLAFPFVYAAIAMSMVGVAPAAWLTDWILLDVLWRLTAGVLVGLAAGWMLGKLFFSAPSERFRLSEHAEGFVALAATFLAYGFAELVEGYGFVAVFVCAWAIRASERTHGYHRVLHQFVEQIERLITALVLILLGGAVVRGLFDALVWTDVLLVAAILFVIRPLTGWLGLLRGKTGPRERFVIAFFGVRGIGSLFYVAYALANGDFEGGERLWGIVGLTVVASIAVHGVTATPVMAVIDRMRAREAKATKGTESAAPSTPV
ncbi:cation:proton antiporter [Planctomonas psychrotolerans]|uniref:cation:proton antiporter n=1 Tax=Planctomonas psychrotolerans TaxID=2528712 RepID=UPI00123B07DB|nr:cation:proton antiporter [Planctomonas psychrotolerans]